MTQWFGATPRDQDVLGWTFYKNSYNLPICHMDVGN